MSNSLNPGDPGGLNPARAGLGLRFILIVIPVTAALGWVVVAADSWIAGPLNWLVGTSWVPVLITVIVYGNGYRGCSMSGTVDPKAPTLILSPPTGRVG
jgi:hypothetical protein